MKISSLNDTVRGWFIGHFDPAVYKTQDFEVGVLFHHKGQKWPKHYHKEAIEINVLISGSMKINGTLINPNDIFIIEKNEVVSPEFLEDCTIVCVKTPSVPGDKYEVES